MMTGYANTCMWKQNQKPKNMLWYSVWYLGFFFFLLSFSFYLYRPSPPPSLPQSQYSSPHSLSLFTFTKTLQKNKTLLSFNSPSSHLLDLSLSTLKHFLSSLYTSRKKNEGEEGEEETCSFSRREINPSYFILNALLSRTQSCLVPVPVPVLVCFETWTLSSS
jgi:hypothetical protein